MHCALSLPPFAYVCTLVGDFVPLTEEGSPVDINLFFFANFVCHYVDRWGVEKNFAPTELCLNKQNDVFGRMKRGSGMRPIKIKDAGREGIGWACARVGVYTYICVRMQKLGRGSIFNRNWILRPSSFIFTEKVCVVGIVLCRIWVSRGIFRCAWMYPRRIFYLDS